MHSLTREVRKTKAGIQKSEVKYWQYFHSVFEYKCYLHLLELKTELGFNIARQEKICILPEDEQFNKLSWNIDFLLSFSSGLIIPVEAKGEWILHDKGQLTAFTLLLRMLSIHKSTMFQQLIIAGETNWIIPNTQVRVCSYKEIKSCLLMKQVN